jgi:hypothetical protein
MSEDILGRPYGSAGWRGLREQWWNQKAYHVKWRERVKWTTEAQRTNKDGYTTHHKRRVARWSSWQPWRRVASATAARRYADHLRKARPWADVGVFYEGKRIEAPQLAERCRDEFTCCGGSDEPLHAADTPTLHCADCPNGKGGSEQP